MTEDTNIDDNPESQSDEPKHKDDATRLNSENAEEILDSVRNKEFFSGLVDGRDVSMVYIHREVKNFYGREQDFEQATVPQPPPETTPKRPRRIGDLVINPLPLWEIGRTAVVYCNTFSHSIALDRLREQGLVILYGEPGIGKRTTAIRLLGELLDFKIDTTIYEMNPDLRLVELRADDLPSDAGLLLESPDGLALEGVDHFHLNALHSELRPGDRNNGMVIVTDHIPSGFPRTHRHLLQPWHLQWPDPLVDTQRDILIRHLRYLANYSPDFVDEIEPQFSELAEVEALNQLLAEALPPAQLAELADLLLPALRGEMSIDEALNHFGRRAYGEVEQWFQGDHPDDLETLLISASVFNGVPYTAVNDASQSLKRMLEPDRDAMETEKTPSRPTSLFAKQTPRLVRLKTIHAHLAPGTQHGHYGKVTEDVVFLDNATWQEAVLRFIWEFDHFRQPFLDWLVSFGAHPRHALRTRAAAAIGALARNDFSTIEAEVLRTWAGSSDANMRRSAAQALGITIWDEAHGGVSSRLLHYWATQKGQPRWQWTAATAYAGLAGPRFPQQTLTDLKVIAGETHRQPALLEPIFRAILNFYAAAQTIPDRRLLLLEELNAWSEIPEKRGERSQSLPVRRAALLSFWVMIWPEREDLVWRLLLKDIGSPGPAQDLAVALVRRSLRFRQPKRAVSDQLHPRKMAQDGIRSLIRYVGSHDDAEQIAHLTGFLAAVRSAMDGDPDEIESLRYRAEQWEDAQEQASDLVQILTKA